MEVLIEIIWRGQVEVDEIKYKVVKMQIEIDMHMVQILIDMVKVANTVNSFIPRCEFSLRVGRVEVAIQEIMISIGDMARIQKRGNVTFPSFGYPGFLGCNTG